MLPFFKPAIFSILLLLSAPSMAHGFAATELVCDRDASVIFKNNYILSSTVTLRLNSNLELPWTGSETKTSVQMIRENSGPESANEELYSVSEHVQFLTFGRALPHDTRLHIQTSLLNNAESDGVIVLEKDQAREVFHCRSR